MVYHTFVSVDASSVLAWELENAIGKNQNNVFTREIYKTVRLPKIHGFRDGDPTMVWDTLYDCTRTYGSCLRDIMLDVTGLRLFSIQLTQQEI